jgi:hypothetical protein
VKLRSHSNFLVSVDTSSESLLRVSSFLPLRFILRVESSMCKQTGVLYLGGLGSRSGGGNNAILIRVSNPCQLGTR